MFHLVTAKTFSTDTKSAWNVAKVHEMSRCLIRYKFMLIFAIPRSHVLQSAYACCPCMCFSMFHVWFATLKMGKQLGTSKLEGKEFGTVSGFWKL